MARMQVCSSQCEKNRMDDMGVHPIFFRPGALYMYTDLQLDNIALKAKIYISSLFLCLNPFPCTLKIMFPWVSFKCFYKIKTNIPRRYFKPINLLQLFHPENWYLFGENWLLVITLPASEFSAARETFSPLDQRSPSIFYTNSTWTFLSGTNGTI